jgi:hypothetical protein
VRTSPSNRQIKKITASRALKFKLRAASARNSASAVRRLRVRLDILNLEYIIHVCEVTSKGTTEGFAVSARPIPRVQGGGASLPLFRVPPLCNMTNQLVKSC